MANATTLTGSSISSATPPSPEMCRISGYLINARGLPLAGWAITLVSCYSPLGSLEGTLILQERMVIKADKNGYVEFDLIRGSQVIVELPNLLIDLPATPRKVPDLSNIELAAFVFPYLVSAEWTDPDPRAVQVGSTINAQLTGTLSSGDTVILLASAAVLEVSDTDVLAQKEGSYYTGISAGTAQLTVTSIDGQGVYNVDSQGNPLLFLNTPAPSLPASPLTVTVS